MVACVWRLVDGGFGGFGWVVVEGCWSAGDVGLRVMDVGLKGDGCGVRRCLSTNIQQDL